LVLTCSAMLVGPHIAIAATPTYASQYVFTPNPIGSSATTGPGVTIDVAVTAETSTGTPVPGVALWLAFKANLPIGGSARVGAVGLDTTVRSFFTDSNGQVVVSYTTPSAEPSSGEDVLRSQNAGTLSASTVVGTDRFVFVAAASFVFSKRPMARKGSLEGNVEVPVTVQVLNRSGAPIANTVVWLFFRQTTRGGSATADGVPLSATPVAVTTNADGEIDIIYATPKVVPLTGVDKVGIENAQRQPSVVTVDDYNYSLGQV
jgi:hypothetical protein